MFKNEIRLVPKPQKTSPDIKVAWCFPHDYSIGMSGLGFQLIYNLFDSAPDVEVTRVFKDVEEQGADRCQLFGFTVSWELDFINILTMLKKCGFEPRQAMIVGDSAVDILTGRNAGVWTCGVTYGFQPESLNETPPDLLVDSLLELVDKLAEPKSLTPSL